ncbi:hypothetical protein, partial [Xenorhabdus littoralis]|uniref:hypothetical protein n=1 Tax=Xenorhabdus littoralis TaxID=2582835 RepID=UPI0029E7F6C6
MLRSLTPVTVFINIWLIILPGVRSLATVLHLEIHWLYRNSHKFFREVAKTQERYLLMTSDKLFISWIHIL